MKRFIIVIGMITAAISASPPAQAQQNGLYAFSDAERIPTLSSNLYGFDLGAGYAFGKHIAVEGSYFRANGHGSALDGIAGDFLARVPLTRSGNTALFGAVGAEYASGFAKQTGGGRFGGGIELGLLDNIVFRMGVRYRTAIHTGLATNAGLAISF